jgi:CheY-like chemotaxis protein
VTTATNGRQALQYVRQQKFDVVLLDIEMPIMNGFKTLEQLRNLEECINMSVIMLTGKSDKLSVMDSIAMGIDGYLIKPVPKDELISKINEVCNKRRDHVKSKTVLAIDDDMSYLKQLNSLLQDRYNVIMINSTKLALDYLTNHTPDVILLDYQMPLYNGVALLNIIRQNEVNQNIPVIVLSGSLNPKALFDFYSHSPAGYLAKPVSRDVLLAKIEEVLANSTREEANE